MERKKYPPENNDAIICAIFIVLVLNIFAMCSIISYYYNIHEVSADQPYIIEFESQIGTYTEFVLSSGKYTNHMYDVEITIISNSNKVNETLRYLTEFNYQFESHQIDYHSVRLKFTPSEIYTSPIKIYIYPILKTNCLIKNFDEINITSKCYTKYIDMPNNTLTDYILHATSTNNQSFVVDIYNLDKSIYNTIGNSVYWYFSSNRTSVDGLNITICPLNKKSVRTMYNLVNIINVSNNTCGLNSTVISSSTDTEVLTNPHHNLFDNKNIIPIIFGEYIYQYTYKISGEHQHTYNYDPYLDDDYWEYWDDDDDDW